MTSQFLIVNYGKHHHFSGETERKMSTFTDLKSLGSSPLGSLPGGLCEMYSMLGAKDKNLGMAASKGKQ